MGFSLDLWEKWVAWDSESLNKKTFWKEERWERAGVFVGPESALRGEKRSVVVTLDWRTRVWFMIRILVI